MSRSAWPVSKSYIRILDSTEILDCGKTMELVQLSVANVPGHVEDHPQGLILDHLKVSQGCRSSLPTDRSWVSWDIRYANVNFVFFVFWPVVLTERQILLPTNVIAARRPYAQTNYFFVQNQIILTCQLLKSCEFLTSNDAFITWRFVTLGALSFESAEQKALQ